MKWFNHAPTEECFYWVRKEDGHTTMCEIVKKHWRDGDPPLLFFAGNECEEQHKDSNWYFGPIIMPEFNDKEQTMLTNEQLSNITSYNASLNLCCGRMHGFLQGIALRLNVAQDIIWGGSIDPLMAAIKEKLDCFEDDLK